MSQTVATLAAPPTDVRSVRLPVPVLAAGLALALAHLPLLIAHGFVLWGRPHYQFFPIVLIGAGVLAWPVLRKTTHTVMPTPTGLGWSLLGVNWLMLTAALVLDSPWLGAVAFLELLVALGHAFGGWSLVRALLPALVYLLLVIPPPFGLDGRLVNSLQTLTSKCANYILDYLGVLHLMSGNVIEIGGKRYFVEQACSGINSLLSVLACTLFFVFWARPHWLRGLLLLAAAVFWVIIANITRVVTIVYFDSRFGIDLLKDPQHALLGFVLFALVLLLLVSTDRFLLFIGTSVAWGARKSVIPLVATHPEPAEPAPGRGGWGLALPVTVAYGLLVLLQGAGYAAGLGEQSRYSFNAQIVALCNGFDSASLPATIGAWTRDPKTSFTKRDEPEMYYAEHSRSWQFQRRGRVVLLSFDYPYPEWHDLRVCYAGNGWTIGDTMEFRHPLPEQSSELACVKFPIQWPPTRSGQVWFCSFDERGGPVEKLTVAEFRWGERLNALKSGLLRAGGTAPSLRSQVLQVQAKTESYLPMSEQDEKDIEELFLTVAAQLRQKFVAGLVGQAPAR